VALPDTAQRSLEHWSEARRPEMQAFYTLAAARDWAADLRARPTSGHLRLLDVACGSGKFPAALLAAGLPAAARDLTVAIDLRDPSAFSIAEARGVLAEPFEAAAEHEIPLQDLDVRARYDVIWATHAL
jgi:SAM-dependent methyltransferase